MRKDMMAAADLNRDENRFALEPRPRFEKTVFKIGFPAIIGFAVGLAIVTPGSMSTKWYIFSIVMIGIIFLGIFVGKPRQYILTLLILSIQFQASKFITKGIGHFGGAQGIQIQLSDIGLAVLLLIWMYELVLRKKRIVFFPNVTIPALFFIFAGGMSVLNSNYPILSLYEVIRIGKYFLLYLCLANMLRPKEDLPWCINALLASILIQGLISVVQILHGAPLGLGILGESEAQIEAESIHAQRAVGTFVGPNAYGMYIGAIIPIAFAMLFIQLRPIRKLVYMVALSAGIVGLLLSLCRAQWIILPFAIMLVFMLSGRRMMSRRIPWLAAMLFVTIAIAILASFSNLVSSRMGSNLEAGISRLPLARAATRAIMANPLIGMGINTYSLNIRKYAPNDDYKVDIDLLPGAAPTIHRSHPVHNIFLLYAAEIGLIGAAFFLWLITRTYKALVYVICNGGQFSKAVSIGVIGAFSVLLLHSMVDWCLIWNSPFTLFWLLIAIASSLHLECKEGSKALSH